MSKTLLRERRYNYPPTLRKAPLHPHDLDSKIAKLLEKWYLARLAYIQYELPGSAMIDVEFDNLQQILVSMPELRRLDAKKNRVGLNYEDNQQWNMLYGRVIRLFGQEHERLAEQRRALRIPLRIKVNYEVEHEKFHSMSHDISVSGIAVDFTHVTPLNAIAKMQLGIQFTTFLGLWKKKFIPKWVFPTF